MNLTNKETILNELNLVIDLLEKNKYDDAFEKAQLLSEIYPNDSNVIAILAFVYLEKGDFSTALEYADIAVKSDDTNPFPHFYRALILNRLGIYESALNDIVFVLSMLENSYNDLTNENFYKKNFLVKSYHLKAQILAGLKNYDSALEEIDKVFSFDEGKTSFFYEIRSWYKNASQKKSTFITKLIKKNLSPVDELEKALKLKEYWYVNWIVEKVLSNQNQKENHNIAKIIELENMLAQYQIKPALAKAEKYKVDLTDDERFEKVYNKILEINSRFIEKNKKKEKSNNQFIPESTKSNEKILNLSKRTDFRVNIKSKIKPILVRTFNLSESLNSGSRRYLYQFNEKVNFIGAEVITENPFYQKQTTVIDGKTIWYLNDKEVGIHKFNLFLDRNWERIMFVESWGMEETGFWKKGQGRVDIYLNNEKICERWFLIGKNEIVNNESIPEDNSEIQAQTTKDATSDSNASIEYEKLSTVYSNYSLPELLNQLEQFVGLENVKEKMKSFVSYLEFIEERKKLGLKTTEGLSINCVFLGNPGTGKTTVARLLGKIFKAMKILESGHIVEVDRAKLVGQYIGETAQKTEKVIIDAMGGLLFIDEAYTLSKQGTTAQDFGQEAIEILLKRMEDNAGKFAVIVAGYTDEMQSFLQSNPGLKSRFNNYFYFDDYNPDELILILKQFAEKEDYTFTDDAISLLKKELENLFRSRDKSFGNARLVRNIFNELKLQLSKRYFSLADELKNHESLTTIIQDDIKQIFEKEKFNPLAKEYKIKIDDDKLNDALNKLNNLIGLNNIKQSVNELVKLAKYYSEKGENLTDKFGDHIVFTGNPGTGKTTVARLISQIYSALGILERGHLIEADRSSLVSSYIGQTAERTTKIINASLGGTLFIDEAHTLIKTGEIAEQDFGKEAIDTLLKRMEDDRGKFLVIAAGYTDEMNRFLESNPGLKSRFNKFYHFDDFTPNELLEITKQMLEEKNLILNSEIEKKLKIYFNEIYRTRNKNFANARLVRSIVENIVQHHLLRLIDIPIEQRDNEESRTIAIEDIQIIINQKEQKPKIKVEGNQELLNQHLEELSKLVGLESVKHSVEKLIGSLKVSKLREERGLSIVQRNLHSVFLGNPGTGKSTVARLLSKIYKEMGILEKGHLIEVDRAGLIAGYQGQTAKKTEDVINQAIGGTLFIDEAYSLARNPKDFGQEAIDTLLKRMEDYKNKFVVIVAGYPNEMKNFIESNPGLKSRFTNYFYFEDYTPRQMVEIASLMSMNDGYSLDEGALQYLLEIFSLLYSKRDYNFGNARTVRNILNKAISNQEERILSIIEPTVEELTTITFVDVQKITDYEF